MSSPSATETLQLAHCGACGAYSFPAQVQGCRVCGAAPSQLQSVPCVQPLRLLNFVTVHSELLPGLPVPCVVGEVQLASGVVEEALIDADEASLSLGMAVQAVRLQEGDAQRWVFRPVVAGTA